MMLFAVAVVFIGLGWHSAATAGGFSENTIFHEDDTDKAQADEVAEALGGTVAVEERPTSFTRCRGGIPVVVVTAVSGA